MTKPTTYQDNVRAASAVIDQLYDRCSQIARKYNLALQTNHKIADSDDWTNILTIDGTEPEYRVGFHVSLSPTHTKPGTAYVWSLVTDLKTDQWRQFIRENVKIDDLSAVVQAGLYQFETFLKDNDGIDPIDACKKHMGTQYYWKQNRVGQDDYEYEADFDNFWSATIYGDRGDYTGELLDQDGNVILELSKPELLPLILEIEAKYKDMRAKA